MAETEPIDDEDSAQEPTAETPADAGDQAGAEGSPPKAAPVPTRNAKFRAGLIERLAPLGYPEWSVKDDSMIDAEWGVVNLKADAVLGPLEPFAPERRV